MFLNLREASRTPSIHRLREKKPSSRNPFSGSRLVCHGCGCVEHGICKTKVSTWSGPVAFHRSSPLHRIHEAYIRTSWHFGRVSPSLSTTLARCAANSGGPWHGDLSWTLMRNRGTVDLHYLGVNQRFLISTHVYLVICY